MHYAAHVITSEATALGDPEIIVMTPAGETGAATEVERFPVGDNFVVALESRGYRVGSRTACARVIRALDARTAAVETGYDIYDVSK